MGFGWFLLLARVLKAKDNAAYSYRYIAQLIKDNPLPTYLSIIIVVMSIVVINLNMKIHVLTRESISTRSKENTVISDPCFIPEPIAVPVTYDELGKKEVPPPTPLPSQIEEKPALPNIRRYASDKLLEISRSLDDEGS